MKTQPTKLGSERTGTFPRGFANHLVHADNAEILEKLARETGGNVSVERARYTYTPGDEHTLRGIPAIGRGCPGRIPGTRPDAICDLEKISEAA